MAQVILKIAYRPVRLAFCIKHGDKSAFRKAVSLSHTFWGGIYTPILAVGESENPTEVAARYGVDSFYALSEDAAVIQFAKESNKSAWPFLSEDLFIGEQKLPEILDVSHALFQLRDQLPSLNRSVLPVWKVDDPLADIFACFFGTFPSVTEGELNFQKLYEELLVPQRVEISNKKPFPSFFETALTPRRACAYRLHYDRRYNYPSDCALYVDGIFFGKHDEFSDVLAYWNLLASNVNAVFFDEAREKDFVCWKGLFEARKVIWTAQNQSENLSVMKNFSADAVLRSVDSIKPLVMGFNEQTVIAISDGSNEPRFQVMKPAYPYPTNATGRFQHVAAMVDSRFSQFDNSDYTLFAPGFPELSGYVGKNSVGYEWKSCRVHRYGTDYIQNAMSSVLFLKPHKRNEILKQALHIFGIDVKESKPGLIANRLMKQMNGAQQCRIFKVAGVRQLFKDYGAEKSFTKTEALRKIGPNLDGYDFYLPGRDHEKLTAQSVFDHLIDQGIIRVGLEFECTNCNLNFWRLIDFVQSVIYCDFCGEQFSITKQLEGPSCWKYRVSGLFSQHKDQQGAIPVAVTLQQMEGYLAVSCESIFSTALELSSSKNFFAPCETDLLFFGREEAGNEFLILGECKGATQITIDSVNKLKAVADSIPVNRLRTYLLFSKFSQFTDQEIEFFKTAQHPDYWRIILLSGAELERSSIYENRPQNIGIPRAISSADEWAAISALLFFNAGKHLENLRNSDGTFRKRTDQKYLQA